ncbi:MAG: hypothetical protein H0Z35_09720 [Thermoanaerobacteraceae bacterium]|nr:hypothetical protein [Thermoanaerobacteraceae bacterium]
MWYGVFLLALFIVFGIIPLNFLVKGMKRIGIPYWPRIILGVIYLVAITEIIGRVLARFSG